MRNCFTWIGQRINLKCTHFVFFVFTPPAIKSTINRTVVPLYFHVVSATTNIFICFELAFSLFCWYHSVGRFTSRSATAFSHVTIFFKFIPANTLFQSCEQMTVARRRSLLLWWQSAKVLGSRNHRPCKLIFWPTLVSVFKKRNTGARWT